MFGLFKQKLFSNSNPYKGMTPAQQAANLTIVQCTLGRLKRELYALYNRHGAAKALASDQAKEIQKLAASGFINLKQGLCIGGHAVLYSNNGVLTIKRESH